MASIRYETIKKCPGFQANAPNKPSKNTIEQYKTHAIKFAQWVKTHYHCRTYEQILEHCIEYLNAYSAYLQAEGKSAATIHTYLAACCYAFNVPMNKIQKPERHCYTIERSRGSKAVDKRVDAQEERFQRLADFAHAVGVRRHDYVALRGDNLKYDESGYLCVEIMKGKGGKYQLQRILPQDLELVRSYFNGSHDYVFTREEMKNKIDLHHIRALGAQRAYAYYLQKIENEPGYREQLTAEIEARWKRYRGTPPKNSKKNDWAWRPSRVEGHYTLRGKNRTKAIRDGFPVSYSRLAVMAVSVFHLSHWRCDVTVDNYLVAK